MAIAPTAVLNMLCMRSGEMSEGISVKTKEGTEVGKSKVAAA